MGIQWVLSIGFEEVIRDFTEGSFSGVQTADDAVERGYTRMTLFGGYP